MSRIPRRSRLLVIVVGFSFFAGFVALLAWPSEESAPSSALQLVYGSINQGRLPEDRGKSYAIRLRAGQFVHLVAEQLGADIELTLSDPLKGDLYQVDRPIGPTGTEQVSFVALSDGEYRIRIGDASGGKYSGPYRIFIQELRKSTLQDRKNAEAERDFYQAKALHGRGALREAERGYRESIRLWGEVKNRVRQADGFCGLGDIGMLTRDWSQAISAYKQCAESREADKNLLELIPALVGRAQAEEYLGHLSDAKALYAQALRLSESNKPEDKIQIEYRLATIQISQGETSQALEHLGKVIALGKSGKDQQILRLRAVSARGALYASLGKEDLALDDLERSFALAGELSSFEDQAVALRQEANIYASRGEFVKAIDLLKRSLGLRGKTADGIGEGTIFSSLGNVYYLAGRFDDALSAFQRAEQIFDKLRATAQHTVALTSLAWIHAVQQRPEIALKIFNDALPLARKGGNKPNESAILYGIAYAERQRGNLIISEARIDEAIKIMESLRSSAARADLQAAFFSDRESLYGFKIELLMDQHSLKPKSGYDMQAFQTSERARARGLYEALVKSSKLEKIPQDLLQQRYRLQKEINRWDLAHRRPDLSPQAKAGAIRHLHEVIALNEEVELKIQAAAGPVDTLSLLPSLSVWEVQNKVLDADTVLLEYYIAKDRVFLWAVSPRWFHSYEIRCPGLPGMISDTYSMWARGDSYSTQVVDVRWLSQCLLGPVTEVIGEKRLVVVSHGVLQKLPFAALLDPAVKNGEAPPLFVRHEITNAPSISVLAMLRKQREKRSPASIFLSLMADAVYGLDDERLPKGTRKRLVDANGEPSTLDFGRLRSSRKEAEAILDLSRGKTVDVAIGFKARREWALAGHLQHSQVVHLALHGSLNEEEPKLSGLVLSQVDSRGKRIDGLLRSHEIEDMKFSADLVVLSACRSGLGKDLRGEGLLALSQSFLSGGASAVVASLWKIDDRATAELMKRFYHGLIIDNLSPASALRKAQIEMWRDAHWRDPYYWAGFVLQGEWRGRQQMQ